MSVDEVVAFVLRKYPSYRLPDFYSKTFLQGGLTRSQVMFLFDSADKERYEDYRFMAAIQGIDIDEGKGTYNGSTSSQSINKSLSKNPFVFKDPAEYEHLSKEERDSLTQDMLKHWKKFSLHSSPKKS